METTMYFRDNYNKVKEVKLVSLPYGIGYSKQAGIIIDGEPWFVNVGTLYFDKECTKCLL